MRSDDLKQTSHYSLVYITQAGATMAMFDSEMERVTWMVVWNSASTGNGGLFVPLSLDGLTQMLSANNLDSMWQVINLSHIGF